MKILFLNGRKFDYGQDLCFSGLVSVLGLENIRAFPYNSRFFINMKGYPKNLGQVTASPLKYLKSQTITAKNCDLIIVGSPKPETLKNYLSLINEIPSSTPIALIEGGDPAEIGGEAERLGGKDLWSKAVAQRPFDFIFKREYLKNHSYADNVYPFPFSMNINALGVPPTWSYDKDVCFWAMESHPIRTKALELLKGQFDCDKNGTAKNQTLKNYKYKGRRYHEELSKCRICINLRGGGWDTLRYWEVPALGPLMVTQKLGIEIPNDFIEGEHIAYVQDDLSDLIDVCEHYLKNEDLIKKMSKAALGHLKKYHTNTARAEFLIKTVKPSS